MRNKNRVLIAVFVALLVGEDAFGQQGYTDPDPIHLKCAIDWINQTRDGIYHQETESQCIGGTWHNLTYIYTFGNKGQIPLMDVDTGKMCACPASGSSAQLSPLTLPSVYRGALKPHQEDNCDSPEPYDDSAADSEDLDGLLQLLEGSAGPDPFVTRGAHPALAPMGVPLGAPKAATKPPVRAATGSGSFVFTLPFRALPAAPLLLSALPSTQPACLSSANPTYFETAHINNLLNRFNACTGANIASIPVANLPLEVRVTPDGTQAIVTHYSSAISFIDTASNTVTAVLQTPASFTPSGLAISPDGRYALVTNLEPAGPGGAAIGVVDIASRTMTSTISLDTDYPRSVYINPDATLAWVVYPFNSSVEVIDLLTGVVVREFGFDEPISVAFNATGTVVYVAEGGGVDVIDGTTYAITTKVSTGPVPGDLLVTPDGAYVVVNNSSGSSISVIDTQTLLATTLAVNGTPRGNVAVPVQ
jgi:DNA-binding beta-propeller fold protein YncE